MQFAGIYRLTHGVFATNGIFFNHESHLRGRSFVTRKITYNMARLKIEGGASMKLGNFSSARDWGCAYDYMNAAFDVLQLDKPGDFIFATGTRHTIRDILSISANRCNFNPKFVNSGEHEQCIDQNSDLILAEISPDYYRPFDTNYLVGDASLIQNSIKRTLKNNFKSLIENMVDADIKRRKEGNVDV